MRNAQFAADRSSRNVGIAVAGALIGAAVLFSLPAAMGAARRWRTRRNVRHPHAEDEPAIDESLDDTYPASDPPSQRYVDIPVNRR